MDMMAETLNGNISGYRHFWKEIFCSFVLWFGFFWYLI